MRPLDTSTVHVPQVYHHTEQRGPRASDKVNVTTYVFSANPRDARPSSVGRHRSFTPQPTATYSEERTSSLTRGRKPSGPPHPSYHPPATHAPVPAPPAIRPQPRRPYHAGGGPYGPPEEAVDEGHVLSVNDARRLFDQRSRETRQYTRHTNRSYTASAPPVPGRYEYRTREPARPGYELVSQKPNYEVYRAVSTTPASAYVPVPTHGPSGDRSYDLPNAKPIRYVAARPEPKQPQPKRIGRSSTSVVPIYQRLVPDDSPNGVHQDDSPPWYGTLRSNHSGYNGNRYEHAQSPGGPQSPLSPGGYVAEPSRPPSSNYNSLPKYKRSKSLNNPAYGHYRGPANEEYDPYATDDELVAANSRQRRYTNPPPGGVTAGALKASVQRAAQAKQQQGLLTTYRPQEATYNNGTGYPDYYYH